MIKIIILFVIIFSTSYPQDGMAIAKMVDEDALFVKRDIPGDADHYYRDELVNLEKDFIQKIGELNQLKLKIKS